MLFFLKFLLFNAILFIVGGDFMNKKIRIVTIVCTIIIALIVMVVVRTRGNKISVESFDKKSEFSLCKIKTTKFYTASASFPGIGFDLDENNSFIENYVLKNEYYLEEYYFASSSIKYYMFKYEGYYYSLSYNGKKHFYLTPCYKTILINGEKYRFCYPEGYGEDFDDKGEVNFKQFYSNIKTMDELKKWYTDASYDVDNLVCFDVVREEISNKYCILIDNQGNVSYKEK